MKAITIWQPWATLVITGAKSFETRSWAPQHRGPLVIHAGKKWTAALKDLCFTEPFCNALSIAAALTKWTETGPELPLGALLGVVEVVECHPTDKVRGFTMKFGELAFGDFTDGRFAWELVVCKRFAKPIPYRGHQGMWDVSDELLVELR